MSIQAALDSLAEQVSSLEQKTKSVAARLDAYRADGPGIGIGDKVKVGNRTGRCMGWKIPLATQGLGAAGIGGGKYAYAGAKVSVIIVEMDDTGRREEFPWQDVKKI